MASSARQVVAGKEYKLSAPLSGSLPSDSLGATCAQYREADASPPEHERIAASREALQDEEARSSLLRMLHTQRSSTYSVDSEEANARSAVENTDGEKVTDNVLAVATSMRPGDPSAAASVAQKLNMLNDMGFPLHRSAIELEAASLDLELAVNSLSSQV